MKISLNWINDYVDLEGIDIKWLTDKITVTTAEIEEIHILEEDTIIEIDNKSLTHRPDLWCHYGMAREVSAITGRPLKEINYINPVDLNLVPAEEINIKVVDSDNCLRYSAISVDNVKSVQSPDYLRKRLENVGMRSINLLVDLANYVMLDIGQPLHTFDKSFLNNIVVYAAEEDFPYTSLDENLRTVPKGSVVIGTELEGGAVKPLSIAGIIGGKESEITSSTSGILLEAATFNAVSIRKTSSKLGLRTDASVRYEKFLDTNLTDIAVGRYLKLLKEYQPDIKITSKLSDHILSETKSIEIELDHKYIEVYLGNSIEKEKISAILTSLGFVVKLYGDKYVITVPTHRATRDVTTKADIIEEILRMYGYDNIKGKSFEMNCIPVQENEIKTLEYSIKELLVNKFNFNEIHTYCWYDNEWLKKIGYSDNRAISIVNSSVKQYEKLRTHLLPGLLKAAYTNRTEYSNLKIFEIGRVYLKAGNECSQLKHLSALIYNCDGDAGLQRIFMDMKGICNLIFKTFKNSLPHYKQGNLNLSWVHKKNHLAVYCYSQTSGKEEEIGYISTLDISTQKLFAAKSSLVIMEIDIDALNKLQDNPVKYEPISKYPATYLDFSLVTENSEPYETIENVVRSFSSKNLIRVDYIDTYEGEKIPEGKKSTTIRLIIGSKDKTLSLEEIDHIKDKFILHLASNNIALR